MPPGERDRRWFELAELLKRCSAGNISQLSAAEVTRVARLYRQVTIDLARARARGDDENRIRFLNDLAVRAHARIYSAQRVDVRPLFAFFTRGFPRLFRKHWRPIGVTAAIFLLTSLASAAAVIHEPGLAYSLFDEGIVEHENLRLEKQNGEYRGNFTFSVAESPLYAAVIIGNNCRAAMLMFAAGSLCCIPGLSMLVYNGRMVGTLSGMLYNGGYLIGFYSLIMTHGVLELSAICIAAAAGLQLGWALIAATNRPRRDAIKLAGQDALGLLGGSCGILIIAGLIEAYITPHFGAGVRWSVAGGSGALLAMYLGLCGRRRVESKVTEVAERGAIMAAPRRMSA